MDTISSMQLKPMTDLPNIIALGFEAESGKDTVANWLNVWHGYTPTMIAGPIKIAAQELFDLTPNQVYKHQKDEFNPLWGMTNRELLQKLMKVVRDTFGEDAAMKLLKSRVTDSRNPAFLVVTDIRRINEAETIQSWGGKVVRIDRPDLHRKMSADAAAHVTEHELLAWDKWDYVITNDGDLSDLEYKVRAMLAKFMYGEIKPPEAGPQIYETLDNVPLHEPGQGDVVFAHGGQEFIRLSPKGTVKIRGQVVDNNPEVYAEFKLWLTKLRL